MNKLEGGDVHTNEQKSVRHKRFIYIEDKNGIPPTRVGESLGSTMKEFVKLCTSDI